MVDAEAGICGESAVRRNCSEKRESENTEKERSEEYTEEGRKLVRWM